MNLRKHLRLIGSPFILLIKQTPLGLLFSFVLIGTFHLLFISTASAQEKHKEKEVAIIAIHGKWGAPPGPIANYLQNAGFTVESPTMPWSRFRLYDVAYEDGLKEVHQRVSKLKAQGFKKIVMIGHSFGANGTLAYASQYQDVDALVLLAPGHVPEISYEFNRTTFDVNKAREMVSSGRGDESFTFTDPNSGNRSRPITAKASIYLSYFEPQSMANMPLSASRIQASLPVLLINSSEDGISRKGESYIFTHLKKHSKSVFKLSHASHLSTPEENKEEVLKFIQSLQP